MILPSPDFKCLLLQWLSYQNSVYISLIPILTCNTRSQWYPWAHYINDQYQQTSSSSYHIIHSPPTSSLPHVNIFLHTWFSETTCNVYWIFKVIDHVPQPHATPIHSMFYIVQSSVVWKARTIPVFKLNNVFPAPHPLCLHKNNLQQKEHSPFVRFVI